jgi:hypothetical protein
MNPETRDFTRDSAAIVSMVFATIFEPVDRILDRLHNESLTRRRQPTGTVPQVLALSSRSAVRPTGS